MKEPIADFSKIVHLKELFPIIKDISIAYSPLSINIFVSIYKPLYIVNNFFVLAENNAFFESDYYNQLYFSDVPKVFIADRYMDNADTLLLALKSLPHDFRLQHSVSVVDKNQIRLTDRDDPWFDIICSIEKPLALEWLFHCKKIKNSILKDKANKKDFLWAADTRFADYIIAYREIRGGDGTID